MEINFYCEKSKYSTSRYLSLFRSSHSPFSLFSKISPENTGGRVCLLIKLQTDCSEWRLYTKITPPNSEAAIQSHSFLKISPGNTGVRVLLTKLKTDCSE